MEESVSGIVRTPDTFISFNGAWAQNVNKRDFYIDLLGDKGGVRIDYFTGYTRWGAENGRLFERKPLANGGNPYALQAEEFAEAVLRDKPSRAEIRSVLPSQRLLDMIYASSEQNREILCGEQK